MAGGLRPERRRGGGNALPVLLLFLLLLCWQEGRTRMYMQRARHAHKHRVAVFAFSKDHRARRQVDAIARLGQSCHHSCWQTLKRLYRQAAHLHGIRC